MKSHTVRSYRNVIGEPVYISETQFPDGHTCYTVYRIGHVAVSQHETLAQAEQGAATLLDRYHRLHTAVHNLNRGRHPHLS